MKEEQYLPELSGKAFGSWILTHPPGTTGGLAESIRCALGHSEQFRGCGTKHGELGWGGGVSLLGVTLKPSWIWRQIYTTEPSKQVVGGYCGVGEGVSQSAAWHHKGPRHQPVRPCWGGAGHKGCFLRRLRAGKTKPQTNSNSSMGMARPAPIQLHPHSQLPGRACLLGDCSSS